VYDKLETFIEKYKLATKTGDYESECEKFIGQMELGLEGKPSSLHMIHSFISDAGTLPADRKIIVVDAGGTNLRVATVYFDKEMQPVIENFHKYPMPGTDGEITADEFFVKVAEYILPLADESDSIGICFSYAAQITENKDAVIIEFAKEVKISGAAGLLVCAGIHEHLAAMGASEKRYTLVNDTVATQLAAKITASDAECDGYFGYILGTGANACYTEKNTNITRLPVGYAKDGGMIINVESGYYSLFDRGGIDEQLDRESENPGSHILEKMTSGAYLGDLIKRVLQRAAEEGLFSEMAEKKIFALREIPLYQVDMFYDDRQSDNPLADCFKDAEEDFITGTRLIDCVMRRAAYLNIVVFGSVLLKSDAGKDKNRPALMCVDGTTFYKTDWLRNHIFPLSEDLIEGKLGRYIKIVRVEDAPLIGTAVAGLIN